jgi:hypothetical protein
MIDPEQYKTIARALPVLQQAEPQLARKIQQTAYLACIPAGQDLFDAGDSTAQ